MNKLTQQLIVWLVIIAIALGLVRLGYAMAEHTHSIYCDCGWSTADYEG